MSAKSISAQNGTVTRYWATYYMGDHCTLCGNWGWLDTTGTKTPAGYKCGRVNYCICPNGQAMRKQNAGLPESRK